VSSTIVWLRNDLRLSDNPALDAAAKRGGDLFLVYVLHEGVGRDLLLGGASKWWLHHALIDLNEQLVAKGGSLSVYHSEDLQDTMMTLCRQCGAGAVYWNRRYEPESMKIDSALKKYLNEQGFEAKSFVGGVLNEPQTIQNKSGKPFQVFTPYWKSCRGINIDEPSEFPEVSLSSLESSLEIDQLDLLPSKNWDEEFYESWDPTRKGAEQRLAEMKQGKAKVYSEQRDIPSIDGTSCLSSWLHFGQISPREVYTALKDQGGLVHEGYIRQLYWRDFAHHLMYHFPHSVRNSLRPEYDLFPWKPDVELVEKWRKGETGYPIIDAGMRQLWQTGWMHNRVRMVVASFLVKHLLQDWREGLNWFWDTLIDADLANNVMGWQWCAGSGADAAPYFRIFNPVSQGEKFDPEGEYVKKYLPELSQIPKKFIHKPWELGELELKGYGVSLGVDYPSPIIELKEGRKQALEAFQKFKELRENR